MKKFFHPESIAVVGASSRKIGNQILKNLLHGYRGRIYPVNPNYPELEGLRCFPSVGEIPGPVDLAILLVPAPGVPEVLEACGRKGILRVIIPSSGFAEVGAEGKAIQDRCREVAKQAGIRVWGPNCMGIVDVANRQFFTFMKPTVYEDGLIPGRISLVVQSGMLSGAFLTEVSRKAIGIGKVCSIGNKMDIDECDLLEYLLADPETDAIALYLESIPRGRLFAEIARRAAKPIVVLKGGKSEAGAKAALSHTSSLAGNARLLEGVLRLAGVTLAEDFQEMLNLAEALAMLPPIPPECRTAILTFSGGAGILSCDLLEKHGLSVARLTEQTKAELGKLFPAWMPVTNPVDLFPAMERHGWAATYNQAVPLALADPGVDAVLVHFAVGLETELPDLAALKKKAEAAGKAMMLWLVGRQEGSRVFRLKALAQRIPVYDELSRAATCLAAVVRSRREPGAEVEASPRPVQAPAGKLAKAAAGRVWDEYDSKRLLAEWRIPVVEERLVRDLEEAQEAAREIGFPLVMKGLVPGEVHKSEMGLVHLGIATLEALEETYRRVRQTLDGRGRILLQRQVRIDYELIAGFLRDPQFGPCVMFGLGGVFSEIRADVSFALAPLTRAEALRLIGQIQGKRILAGFRGKAPLNKERTADLLVQLGQWGSAYPEIEQIDINPLAVADGEPVAVDANIVLAGG